MRAHGKTLGRPLERSMEWSQGQDQRRVSVDVLLLWLRSMALDLAVFGALVVGCCLALQVGNSAGAWEMASTIQLTMKVTWLTVHVWACTRMHTRPSFFFACK